MADDKDKNPPVEGEIVTSETGTLAILTKSEIDTQIATAKKYPRSIKRFRDEAMEMVTLTERIAEECIYALPRDGKTIEGPSARFAEIIVSAWGNCRAGARTVGEDNEFVTSQGVFHDLERNVAITYEVKRRITDRQGRRYKPDMVGVTANAACSIGLRNAVLKGIPKAFWADMYDAARKAAIGDAKTLTNKRADMVGYFQKLGASQEMICATLGVAGIEDIGLDELATLKGMATAIKEGDTTVEQAFQVPGKEITGKGVQGLKDALRKDKEPPTSAPEPAATTGTTGEPADKKPGEGLPFGDPADDVPKESAGIPAFIQRATSREDADARWGKIEHLLPKNNKKVVEAYEKVYGDILKKFSGGA